MTQTPSKTTYDLTTSVEQMTACTNDMIVFFSLHTFELLAYAGMSARTFNTDLFKT
jgi:hypothetical protein